MDAADQGRDQVWRKGKKLVKGRDAEWLLRESLARRYHYRGPFDPALIEDLSHPARRPLLIESIIEIPDGERRLQEILLQELPDFLLHALDILGTKLLYAHGFKADGGIYNIQKKSGSKLPKEQRQVKHSFIMDDGTVVKVV